MNNPILIKARTKKFKEINWLSLSINTAQTLCLYIPFTLIEKAPQGAVKLICYNAWTLTPAVLFGTPFLLYKRYWKNESLESIFLNALLPPVKPAEVSDQNYVKPNTDRCGNYTFYRLHRSSDVKTIVFLPGRYGSFKNNEAELNELFVKMQCNIITWDNRSKGNNITLDHIKSGAVEFLEHLKRDPTLNSENTTFYAYSLGGAFLSMMLKKDRDSGSPIFQESYIVVERSFRSLKKALRDVSLKCLPLHFALTLCDKNIFGPDLFENYPLEVIPNTKAQGFLFLTAIGDFTISKSYNCKKSDSQSYQETLNTTTSFDKPTWHEIGVAAIIMALNLYSLNAALLTTSIYLSTMYLVHKNPHYFNTHTMPYAFTTDEVREKMQGSKKN
jgi:hypothetical protein